VTRTYLYGYSGGRRTLADMETRSAWNRVHPEMRRRLVALFDASQDANREVGFGEGWRSSASQQQVFLERHTQVSSGGCCGWDGKRWQLKPGMAHAAPPGRSYHEETDGAGNCFAIDAVGDLDWAGVQAGAYGLKDFSDVNDEKWHFQPVELPNSRSSYTGQTLAVWPLPTPPTPPTPPPPPPPVPGVNVTDQIICYGTAPTSKSPAVYALFKGGYKIWFKDQATWTAHKQLVKDAGLPAIPYRNNYSPDQFRACGPILGPRPANTDEWGM